MKYLTPERIRPVGRYVLIQAEHAASLSDLHLPDLSRYPTTGWVEAVGTGVREPITPGDFVVVENESIDIGGAPIDFFEVILDAGEGEPLRIALERESAEDVTALWRAYQRNSDLDQALYALDIFTDEQYRFLLSDILDVYTDTIHKQDTRLEYIHTRMLHLTEGLFYLIPEDLIMCTVETE